MQKKKTFFMVIGIVVAALFAGGLYALHLVNKRDREHAYAPQHFQEFIKTKAISIHLHLEGQKIPIPKEHMIALISLFDKAQMCPTQKTGPIIATFSYNFKSDHHYEPDGLETAHLFLFKKEGKLAFSSKRDFANRWVLDPQKVLDYLDKLKQHAIS